MTEGLGRRAIQHLAFRIEAGIVTGAGKLPGYLVPIDSTGKVRAAAGQHEDIIDRFGPAQDIAAVVAGGAFPTVDFGYREGEGVELANRDVFQFSNCYRCSRFTPPSAQERSNSRWQGYRSWRQ